MPEQPQEIVTALQQLFGTSLTVGATFPGEAVVVAAFEYGKTVRETMDPALRTRYDAVMVQTAEDASAVWRKIWKSAGVLE